MSVNGPTADGIKHDITEMVQDGGWEEGKGELSCRINGKVVNGKIDGKRLSSRIKNGCVVYVMASTGGKNTEVARGTLTDWQPSRGGGGKNDFDFVAYDSLYSLQESSDNLYFTKGTRTKSALTRIFRTYKIPSGRYDGPDVKHAKMAFKNKKVSEMILDILDEAHTKGGKECIVRSVKGKVQVVPKGSNADVYHFSKDEATVVQYKQSTAGMVTRVKVIGQENGDKKAATVAVVNGKTRYGIRQQIYTKPKNDSVDAAKKEAKRILKEKGTVAKTMTVESPDVPYIRKGDKVHIDVGAIHGYCHVAGIRHYTNSATMSMDLEYV